MTSVLAVDDDVLFCEYVAAILGDEGYSVTTAFDGLEAVEAFNIDDFDVLITDIDMPRMDGVSLIQHVRSRSRLPPPAIFILSARSVDGDVRAGLGLAESAVLHKPISPDKMRLAIQGWRAPAANGHDPS